jgi:hypothetical protein
MYHVLGSTWGSELYKNKGLIKHESYVHDFFV